MCNGWKSISARIREKLTEDERITDRSSCNRYKHREKWSGVLIFNAITEDAEEAETTTLKQKPKAYADQK
jgi:hypothetical protein